MDNKVEDNKADDMDVQSHKSISLESISGSSEGSGVNIFTPAASQAGENGAPHVTQDGEPTETEAVHLDEEQISDWVADTTSLHSGLPEQVEDMTLITHEETNSLGGSAYELIDDDFESSHGAETESISDCSISRPSDVVSIADDEHSVEDTESEASLAQSAIPAYAGLDDNEDTPRVGLSTANVHNEPKALPHAHDVCLQHIAFDEPESEGVETASQVAVMHTVKEFSKQEADAIALQIGSRIHQRLVGTIRQTMTKEYLALTEPLRIMYVGSHQARQDILQKLGSSVAASRHDSGHDYQTTQLYNVVPISAFGSGKTPEVELTQSSAVQFKVCDLEKALREHISANPNDPNILKLTIDRNSSIRSLPGTKKFEIRPENWEKPHIAVFYCSDTDTEEMRNTLEVANSFMQRHNIPRIVISHKPLFDAATKTNLRLGHQPIHMCLESRDPARAGNSIHFRLPIDLTSFLNIDAIQMNRNLACITGLYEATPIPTKSEEKEMKLPGSFSELWMDYRDARREALTPLAIEARKALREFTTSIERFSVPQLFLFGLLVGFMGYATVTAMFQSPSANHDIIHHNGRERDVAPIISIISPPPASMPMSTSYSTTTRTTTITQTVTHAPTTTSTTVTPPKATGGTPNVDTVMDLISSFTSADLQGKREVFLRTTKGNIDQMKKDANLAFRLWREVRNASHPCAFDSINQTLVWEKASWADGGVSVLLKEEDVHGILKVGVESKTAEGRKIRKTYNVKLSKDSEDAVTWNQIGKCIQDEVIPLLVDSATQKVNNWTLQAAKSAHLLTHKSQDAFRDARTKFRAAQLKEKMAKKMERMKKLQARIAKQAEKTERMAGEVHKAMGEKLLKTQVKSRLIWLRRKGMYREASEYEAKAIRAGVFGKTEEMKQESEQIIVEGQKPIVMPKTAKKACGRGIGKKARKCRAAATRL